VVEHINGHSKPLHRTSPVKSPRPPSEKRNSSERGSQGIEAIAPSLESRARKVFGTVPSLNVIWKGAGEGEGAKKTRNPEGECVFFLLTFCRVSAVERKKGKRNPVPLSFLRNGTQELVSKERAMFLYSAIAKGKGKRTSPGAGRDFPQRGGGEGRSVTNKLPRQPGGGGFVKKNKSIHTHTKKPRGEGSLPNL